MQWVAALRSLTRRAASGPAPSPGPRRAPADLAQGPQLPPGGDPSLDELFATALREHEHQRTVLVDSRLRTLSRRRVPVRAVRPSPAPDAARICFANGTVLLVRPRRRGDLLTLAVGLRSTSVCIESWAHHPEGTAVRFTWGHRSAELWALGLDQAD